MNAGPLFPNHRVSPAQVLDLIVGCDAEGWATYRTFRVGDIVMSCPTKAYRVAGFTLGNTVLVTQHGLAHDPMVMGLEFEPKHLYHMRPASQDILMHSDGLVLFAAPA